MNFKISGCHSRMLIFISVISYSLLSQAHISSFVRPSFFPLNYFESMKAHSGQFEQEYKKNNPVAFAFKALYDQFIINDFMYQEELRIPKIIHQIWLGSRLPQQYRIWQQTWIDYHPDWTYILWTDTDIENFPLINRKLYDVCNSLGAKADIARYEILYQFGGLYVDCDVECLQPCDIFHHCCDFYASCDNAEKNNIMRITNALIGVKPAHPIMKMCIEKIHKQPIKPLVGSETIIAVTGPGVLTASFCESASLWDGPCVVFPATFFVPLPWSGRFKEATSSDERVKDWIKPESYAIHYWHGSWTNYSHKFKVQ